MDDRGNYFIRHRKTAKSTANSWDGRAVRMAGPRLSDGRRPRNFHLAPTTPGIGLRVTLILGQFRLVPTPQLWSGGELYGLGSSNGRATRLGGDGVSQISGPPATRNFIEILEL